MFNCVIYHSGVFTYEASRDNTRLIIIINTGGQALSLLVTIEEISNNQILEELEASSA